MVFSFEIPHAKENVDLDMSRWFQNLISVLKFDMDYSLNEGQQYRKNFTMNSMKSKTIVYIILNSMKSKTIIKHNSELYEV